MTFGTQTGTGGGPAQDTDTWTGPTWQYATVMVHLHRDGQVMLLGGLKEMGQRGWEAVGMTVVGASTQVLLKRPVRD